MSSHLGVFENQEINLVITFEEFEVQLDRFLPCKNTTQLVIYFFCVLFRGQLDKAYKEMMGTHKITLWKLSTKNL